MQRKTACPNCLDCPGCKGPCRALYELAALPELILKGRAK